MTEINELIKQTFPEVVNWERFEDMDRALNWELWNGPLPENYWTEVEPLEHYVWVDFETAENDLREILDPLPSEMYYDVDGGEILTEDNPEDYAPYWQYRCLNCDQWISDEDNDGSYMSFETGSECADGYIHEPDDKHIAEWCGGEWSVINVRKQLMFKETYSQVF